MDFSELTMAKISHAFTLFLMALKTFAGENVNSGKEFLKSPETFWHEVRLYKHGSIINNYRLMKEGRISVLLFFFVSARPDGNWPNLGMKLVNVPPNH
jgi:hypothetical protein